MRRWSWPGALLTITLLAAACSGDADDGSAAPAPEPEATEEPGPAVTEPPTPTPTPVAEPEPEPTGAPEVEVAGQPVDGGVPSWLRPHLETVTDCDPGLVDGIDSACYRLTVAADRDDPSGGTVVLPLRVLSPAGVDAPGDAIVSPAGGPGFPGLGRSGALAAEIGRDVVTYDQRGTGESVPSLECPAADAAFRDSLLTADPWEDERAAILAAREQCAADLETAGVDLTDYTSIASTHDLEDIRAALGYESWNLIGVSYGGRLSLVTMREYPETVRSAVLDSVYDVSYGGLSATVGAVERAFGTLVDSCAASEPCAARGDLGDMLDRVVARYNDQPIESTVSIEGQPLDFVITGDDLVAGLFQAMYDTNLVPVLPSVVAQLDEGSTAIVGQFIADGVPFATGAADLMEFAVNCADNAGLGTVPDDRAVLVNPGRFSTIAAASSLCPTDWPATSPTFNEPIVSDIPSLLLAGGLDPITPPGPTLALADHLSNSTTVFHPAAGHGVWTESQCTVDIMFTFIEDPSVPLDTSCADELPELRPS